MFVCSVFLLHAYIVCLQKTLMEILQHVLSRDTSSIVFAFLKPSKEHREILSVARTGGFGRRDLRPLPVS